MAFPFLPTNKHEMQLKGWDAIDVLLISGDAYVDHPSFGVAVIGRFLEFHGFRVGIIPQPDWKQKDDFLACGIPLICVGVTGGNLDSMIANRSAEKKPRKKDDYSENGLSGKRPDRAVLVYANRVKECFPGVPLVLGGIEASLRRITHYDYWANELRRSILLDTRADVLVYGMAEKAFLQVVKAIQQGSVLQGLPQTVTMLSGEFPADALCLPAHEQLIASPSLFMDMTMQYEAEMAKKQPRCVVQNVQNRTVVVQPPLAYTAKELDTVYELPYQRQAHPRYKGDIPAFRFVDQSIVSHRGCFGGCTFCTLTVHQGKYIVSRTEKSMLNEVQNVLVNSPKFNGTILDVGGPSANMFGAACTINSGCARLSCIFPNICKNLTLNQLAHAKLLQKIKEHPAIKNVFVNSGIRYDLAMQDKEYLKTIVQHHVCGQMSVAPEHNAKHVLDLMQKPSFEVFEKFESAFYVLCNQLHKKQFVIPYFIAAHPGSTLMDMYNLALFLRKRGQKVQQVQTFIPIPMTIGAAMYFCEKDPFSGQRLHVAKAEERIMQRALLQPTLPANKPFVRKALMKLGKLQDLDYLTVDRSRSNN